jgi:hypothetical protein
MTAEATPGTVMFDLGAGQVLVEPAGPHMLVPVGVLEALCEKAGAEATEVFARTLGYEIGLRAASRLTGQSDPDARRSVRLLSPEDVAAELGASWAIAGLGRLSLERWGRALLAVVEASPLEEAGDAMLAWALQGAIRGVTGDTATVARLSREGTRARFLIGSPRACERARALVAGGATWVEAIAMLHEGGGGA